MAVAAVGLTLFAPLKLFFLITLLLAGVCLHEYFWMLKTGGEPSAGSIGVILGFLATATILFGDEKIIAPLLAIILIASVVSAFVGGGADVFRSASNSVFGVFYIAVTLGCLGLIRAGDVGELLVLTLIFANALCDTFAYYTGKNFGKRPLAPKVSPNKTVEGFAGGVVGAIVGALASKLFLLPVTVLWADMIVLGLIAGLLGPMGDLLESSVKRKTGVKDSGNLIPGHGGVWDRLDSLMVSAVAFYSYLALVS